MKKKFLIAASFVAMVFIFNACKKHDFPEPPKKYAADVAVAWMKMQIRLTTTTPGFNSVVTNRSNGYAGLTLYESIVPGVAECNSLLPQFGIKPVLPAKNRAQYFWPASANAAMALITKDLFANTSAANMASIDSLEAVFTTQFQFQATSEQLQNSVDFGKLVATAIFDWSKTDGGHEAYLHITDPTYIPPVGPGLWIPTPPLFGPPIFPHWGNNRSFIPNIAVATQPGPPLAYSENIKSPFYQMVNELYTISLSLTHEDSTIAKFWADFPGNLNVPAHATNILTQLIVLNKFDLKDAAIAYAKHSIAMYDASISVFKTKYTYNLLRPISYIRNVMGHPDWNSVIPTPSTPEYSAAHAVVSAASATVMESIFGKNYSFADHTYDATYGTRSFNSFDDYAKEAAHSRLLGGIHYGPSNATGLIQGRKVGDRVNQLRLKN